MIKNEEYKKILKMMEACVSHGDYYSVKELSNLELEVMNLKEKNTKKEVQKYTKKLNTKEKINKEIIMELANLYSKYILEKIENAKSLSELQSQAISFEEFIKQI